MMYDELVKELRDSEEWATKDGGIPVGLIYRLSQAADAIEELSKRLDESIPKGDAEIIISEVAKPRWIPVTERLPNENDDVLIYGEWTGASGAKYREIWLTDLKGFLHQGYKPIAWMPIPEPPCEERKDPCADCVHYPPSSTDGKPCCACDPANPLTNCHEAKEETE